MKSRLIVFVVFFLIISSTAYSQEKSRKELKEEARLEKQKLVEALVNSKEYIFIGKTALPTGYKSVDLTTRNSYMKFLPDQVESEMPFFGTAHSAVGFGNDNGMKFKGEPENYTIVKKKKAWEVKVLVNGDSDSYRITLLIGFEGSATLSINSNNRSTISYSGKIEPVEKE